MLTRNQKFAAAVYEKVAKFGEKYPGSDNENHKESRNKYGAMAQKLPLLVRTAGLAQAISFLEAKSMKESEKPNKCLLQDLSEVIEKEMNLSEKFTCKCRNASMTEYLRLTQNTLAALFWFKRFSVSVLEVEENMRGNE